MGWRQTSDTWIPQCSTPEQIRHASSQSYSAHRGAVARPAPRLRRRETYPSLLPPVARSGCVGRPVGGSEGRTGLRGVADRCPPYPGPSPGRRRPGRQLAEGAHPRGLNSQWHLVADAQGRPVRMGLTPGTRADCTQAVGRMAGREAEYRIADRGYDRDPVGAAAWAQGRVPGIPPCRHRKPPAPTTQRGPNGGIGGRMLSWPSRHGGAWPLGRPRTPLRCGRSARSGLGSWGLDYFDDTP